MNTFMVPSKHDVTKLQQFHIAHFPSQDVPCINPKQGNSNELESGIVLSSEGKDECGLRFYKDGVKRTLTDEQIRMFRHSEIQKLFQVRNQELQQEKEDTQTAEHPKHNTRLRDKEVPESSASLRQQGGPSSSRDGIGHQRLNAAEHVATFNTLDYGE